MNRRQFFPLAASALSLPMIGCTRSSSRVVVYCAQDEEFAVELFADFEKVSGLKVKPKFDTEANKSVGLAADLVQEKQLPRCDVHWNNEPLGTIRLQRAGVYDQYTSFAARARVLIINNDLVPVGLEPRTLLELGGAAWRGKLCMAKPNFGTTATHMACLFASLQPTRAKELLLKWKANEMQIVPGNKQVAVGVAEGRFAAGLTDTDDAIVELNRGKHVRLVYLDDGTLYLPNTLALVKGCPNSVGGQALIDYLTKPETEARLAKSGAYQIPLHPDAKPELHPAIRTASQVKPLEVNFERTADLWDECQAFLRATITL